MNPFEHSSLYVQGIYTKFSFQHNTTSLDHILILSMPAEAIGRLILILICIAHDPGRDVSRGYLYNSCVYVKGTFLINEGVYPDRG